MKGEARSDGDGDSGPAPPELSIGPMRVEITQSFRFEAAHFLPNVPKGHRCLALHGHSYRVDVSVTGPLDEHTGWVVDFFDIEATFLPLLNAMDHHLLNEIAGLENPTAENIAVWIYTRMKPTLPGVVSVTVHETEMCKATVSG